jgi:glycosyltransferase involved in cell wall biosynthesis
MKLSVVAPCYQEEGNIPEFLRQIVPILDALTRDFEVIFALDPSPDKSQELILAAHAKDPRVKLLAFSRRFGQPMAVLAGMQYSTGDAVIVTDIDLQDPPSLIPAMVAKWTEGFDVVYAQRSSRRGEPLIKRIISWVWYASINRIAEGVEVPRNTGDFRLMSRRVVEQVIQLHESHGFLRGMVALVGFRQTAVQFDRPPRFAGESHYNRFWGSVRIGLNGLICFSNLLLGLSTLMGFSVAFVSLLLAVVYAIMKMVGFPFPLGNPTIVILVLFMGSVQLIGIGILGEYIGRIYDEVKRRPRFIIDKKVGFP